MNKRPENIVGKTQANHGAVNGWNEPVLYLDFDGVLHAYEIGRLDIPGDVLFAFEPLLESQLAPYPKVKIVLSTTWVKSKTGPGALFYLARGLQQRVVGATWEARSFRARAEDQKRPLTRYEQIAADVVWRKPSAWFALDDDIEGWPEDRHRHLGRCEMTRGSNEPSVQQALQAWLDGL